jgi:hypothetical protein
MRKNQKITVLLPNLTPTVDLPPRLGKSLEHVIASGAAGISTIGLSYAGCLDPAKAISELRNYGAMIGKELKATEDKRGELHLRVAHYRYCGWRLDIDSINTTTNTAKE